MERICNIEEISQFLITANRQFEQGGIYLEHATFKRDEETGQLIGITLRYGEKGR